MKTLFSQHKWMQIIYGALFLLAGIAIIALALNNVENINLWLSSVIAAALFIFGVSTYVSSVFLLHDKYFNSVFVYSAIAIALGVVLVVFPNVIGESLVTFVTALLMTIGVIQLGKGAAMIYYKKPKATLVLFFVIGAVFVLGSTLTIIFRDAISQYVYIASGAVIALFGLLVFVLGVYSAVVSAGVNKNKSSNKPVKQIEEKKDSIQA